MARKTRTLVLAALLLVAMLLPSGVPVASVAAQVEEEAAVTVPARWSYAAKFDSFFPNVAPGKAAAELDVVAVSTTASTLTGGVNDHEVTPVQARS